MLFFFFLSLFQIQILNRDLTNYQKRERELLGRLCPAAEKSISEMIQQMEEQYRNLLDCHLAQLRSTYLSSLPSTSCSTNNADNASSSSNTATSTSTDSPVAAQAIVEPGQTESNNTVDYHATAVATTLEPQQEQDVEVNGTDDVEVLHQRQQQEQLAYIANKVVARLQAANSHNGQVHDDIVIITSSDDPGHHTQEEGVVNSEPLIICTSTVEEAALEQTVSCHTSEHTEETTTVVREGDSLDATVGEDITKETSGTQLQVLSIIHTSSSSSSASQDAADEQQKHDGELPPSKRLRTET